MNILEKQELSITNLISLRKKMTQKELVAEIQGMKKQILDLGETPVDLITTTFSAEKNESGALLMDIEILCPIEKEIQMEEPFLFKKELTIVNALCLEFTGSSSEVPTVYAELNKYIGEKKLQPITTAYTVNKNGFNITDTNADIKIYVGINPNIL